MSTAVYTRPGSTVKAVRRRQEFISKGIIYSLLIFGAAMFILPLVIMVSTSLKPITEINSYPPTFLPNTIVASNGE